jgi:hypothetical protein
MNAHSSNRNSNDNSDRSGQSSNSRSSVFRALRTRVAHLPFFEFRRLVLLWLSAKGYRGIQVLPRGGERGRRPSGGADFLISHSAHDFASVAVTVRHWQTPLQRRTVDELVGYLARQSIRTGILVTNNKLSAAALEAASELPGHRLRLYPVGRLAGSMTALGLGVKNVDGQLELDEAFFRTLARIQISAELTRRWKETDMFGRRSGEATNRTPPEQNAWLWIGAGVLVLLWLSMLWRHSS